METEFHFQGKDMTVYVATAIGSVRRESGELTVELNSVVTYKIKEDGDTQAKPCRVPQEDMKTLCDEAVDQLFERHALDNE